MLKWAIAEDHLVDKVSNYLDDLKQPYVKFNFDRLTRFYNTNDNLSVNDEYILFGPIQFINQFKRKYNDLAFWSFGYDQVNCTDYYGQYNLDWFLNSDITFIPFGMLEKKMVDHFSKSDSKIFIRPNSSRKIFTGMIIDKENYHYEISFLKNNLYISNNDLVCYSLAKKIHSEYRCWIVDRKVVDISYYSWDDIDGSNINDFREKQIVKSFCEKIVTNSTWHPDIVYTIDICVNEDIPKIVEFNSFCSAGFYRADVKKILNEVHMTTKKYNGVFNGK